MIQECCLSSPPDDHGLIFMLTTLNGTIIFCRLDCKSKRLKWMEISYAEQLESITGCDRLLCSLTCCNGKVYAFSTGLRKNFIIHIDIVVKGAEIVISLLPYLTAPTSYMNGCSTSIPFLHGCCNELFFVKLCLRAVDHVAKETVGGVCVWKLDMTNLRWDEMKDLQDDAFFLDLAHGNSAFYSPAIASGLGGYVHFLDRSGKVIHSYDFKNKTIALSSMPTSRASLSDHRYCLRLMHILALQKWNMYS
ncbi:hypothetical protein HanXRQr2_Chr01g0039991 [Helianthus annuus]|uniref:KIB1-4 beta-propeller domain-containing protein n=1 Tax=Helianthus annuus TaxID=4232 RepID=A0A9K3JY16_HELAN|nr:hypothetical protein HanXRQr2_Chr01g0039991 [Helianthus annuus]KAJ0612913.1 hypothetical protein HanHA300_Chr01g0032581 [Helianthus annuus]KAJ0624556.1 hypothetical protein HanIR_Chr01g0044361 [Helianthus annuus]KAJ0628300.1 hypothetical protein HanHA89_Chr01g0035131 [Helianthus annuus]KAJ0784583.1 hypothetical protein HanLR1_Chr01g0033601 [Helianthus annuus]